MAFIKTYVGSCYCRNYKVTPGPVFHKFLTPVPDPSSKTTQNPVRVDSGILDPRPPLEHTSRVRRACTKMICGRNGENETQSLLSSYHHRCTGVHIFGDAKNFCPNLVLFFQVRHKQQVLMLR